MAWIRALDAVLFWYTSYSLFALIAPPAAARPSVFKMPARASLATCRMLGSAPPPALPPMPTAAESSGALSPSASIPQHVLSGVSLNSVRCDTLCTHCKRNKNRLRKAGNMPSLVTV